MSTKLENLNDHRHVEEEFSVDVKEVVAKFLDIEGVLDNTSFYNAWIYTFPRSDP